MTIATKTNQIVGSRIGRDGYETLEATSADTLAPEVIEQYRETHDYLEIQSRADEESEYDVIDSWSADA